MDHYFGVAKEEGLTDEEIGAVQSVVMAVSAGRVRAQFQDARIRSRKAKREQKKNE
jgi:mono/diheme cytochrome c family protein